MTIEQLRHEAQKLGYRLVPNSFNTPWSKCNCGSRRKQNRYLKNGDMVIECVDCGFSIQARPTDAKLAWNEAIEEAKWKNQ